MGTTSHRRLRRHHHKWSESGIQCCARTHWTPNGAEVGGYAYSASHGNLHSSGRCGGDSPVAARSFGGAGETKCARSAEGRMSALSFSRVQLLLMQKEIKTLIGLGEEAKRFVAELMPKDEDATLVTLSGELGAGKTAFVKAVALALGVEEIVNSPTFVLEKIYLLSNQTFKRLIHIDAYRLEKGTDLAPLGFDELMRDSGNLILLEWPENVADALPAPNVRTSFVANSDGSRMITYG